MLFSWPAINSRIFSNSTFKIWIFLIIFVYVFFAVGFFGFTNISFSTDIFYWDYDDNDLNLKLIGTIQETTEDSMLVISGIIYILFIISLIKMNMP
uniref:NADH dehydrogenase subunit 5 n=1 Tax=Acrobeloides nanus TaxID=290746 RepID=A0A914DVF7_9BILA